MTLKFPCRQFLHLAAGAAGRIASREGASVSVAAGVYHPSALRRAVEAVQPLFPVSQSTINA